MGNVVELFPSLNLPETLRHIASQLESGTLSAVDMTVIAHGPTMAVFQLGSTAERAAKDAVFNMTFGTHWLADATFRAARQRE